MSENEFDQDEEDYWESMADKEDLRKKEAVDRYCNGQD